MDYLHCYINGNKLNFIDSKTYQLFIYTVYHSTAVKIRLNEEATNHVYIETCLERKLK